MLLNGRREFLPSLTRSVALGSKASEHGFDSRSVAVAATKWLCRFNEEELNVRVFRKLPRTPSLDAS